MPSRKHPSKISLPVRGASAAGARTKRVHGCGTPRRSTRSKWRAGCLILIHLLVAAHVAHWYLTGSTLTPVEPSESMQTLGAQSLVNAGFIFFFVAILATLVLGRFFCGWGCHIVALQDLCTWLLGRMGIRPKPFRSRLLVFVPLLAAAYMFVAPTIVRLCLHQPKAAYTAHLTTNNFWGRFPGWPVATLTFLVCGFLIVYALGNKGFCTYGCPYGGVFGLVDAAAVGRIRVTEACEGCAHCTARCTSNVKVHEEVRTFGMVVDPGCMKCMDCISVCPKDALYFGWGAPALAKGKPRAPRKRIAYDYSWAEECALAALFLVAIVVFRGLYDRIPFLLALGMAAISAYLIFTAGRMLGHANLRFGQHAVRKAGRTTRWGFAVLALAVLCGLLLAQSGAAKLLAFEGNRRLNRAQSLCAEHGPSDATALKSLDQGVRLMEWSSRIGLLPMSRHEWDLANAYAAFGRQEEAEAHLRTTVALSPRVLASRMQLATYDLARQDLREAESHLRFIVDEQPDYPQAAKMLGGILIQQGRASEAVELLTHFDKLHPHNLDIGLGLAAAYHVTGDTERCRQVAEALVARYPSNAEAHVVLGSSLAGGGSYERALPLLRRAVELDPLSARAHFLLAKLYIRLGDSRLAAEQLRNALALEPFNAEIARFWADWMLETGALEAATREAAERADQDRVARFRLAFLYEVAGRHEEARALAAEFVPATQP